MLEILKGRRSNAVVGLQTKPSAGQMFASGPKCSESKHSSAEVFDSSGPLECFMVALRPPAVTCTSARGSLSAGGFRALVRRPSLHLQCRSKRGAGRKQQIGFARRDELSQHRPFKLARCFTSQLCESRCARRGPPHSSPISRAAAHAHLSRCTLQWYGGRLA